MNINLMCTFLRAFFARSHRDAVYVALLACSGWVIMMRNARQENDMFVLSV